jgi:hypothetical protein
MSTLASTVLSRPNDFQPFVPDTPSAISGGITYGIAPPEIVTGNGFTAMALFLRIYDAIHVGFTTMVQPIVEPLLDRYATPFITRVDFTASALADIQIFGAILDLYYSSNIARDRHIADRITVLHLDALMEDQQILPSSLRQFADFFLAHPGLGLPKITLTPDGTLRARWIHGPRNFVAIEFTGEPLAKLVSEIPRQNDLTATNIVSVAGAIGASFT